jgi:hypothetical protein
MDEEKAARLVESGSARYADRLSQRIGAAVKAAVDLDRSKPLDPLPDDAYDSDAEDLEWEALLAEEGEGSGD